jgi:GNAT superfamily N-acetyltransferase
LDLVRGTSVSLCSFVEMAIREGVRFVPDMLVKLYELPPAAPEVASLRDKGVICRRAESFERSAVLSFVNANFPHWADELLASFTQVPPTVFVAERGGAVLGFACYNATRPNYFGPTGVLESERGQGIGRVLLLQCLEALAAQGYAYAIIGGVGPAEFYERAVGATIIERSDPGIYRGMLRPGDSR